MEILGVILLGYLVGSLPTAYILARATKRIDIRMVGSGNVGATNLAIHAGKLPYAATLMFDLVKGALVIAVLSRYGFSLEAQIAAGLAAIAGHNWTLWLNFMGGRGIATTGGVLFMFGPLETILTGVVLVIGSLVFKQGAIATLILFALWSPLAFYLDRPSAVVVCGVIAWLFIVARRLQGSPGVSRKVTGENVYWNRLWLDRDIQNEEEWVKQRKG